MAARHQLQALRNHPNLQRFLIASARPTGRQLGVGSYGSVEELEVSGIVCAGKKIHETLIEQGNFGAENIASKYVEECQLMSDLRHPHLVQFLGVCFLPNSTLPVLVMERLLTSLDDLLEHNPDIPLSLKRSILADVARGLVYLHSRSPPVIHRDLSAKNVLLNSAMMAKISDLGNARIVNFQPGQLARTLSRVPGTMVYMPPEAFEATSKYGPSLDSFSFGHLSLFTITQVFPGTLLQYTYRDPKNPRHRLARTEVQRRDEYIRLLHQQLGEQHPLVLLVKQCLDDEPSERPSAQELLQQLEGMKGQIEDPYQHLTKLEAMRMLREKDREIHATQVEASSTSRQELETLKTQMEQFQVETFSQLTAKDAEISRLGEETRSLQRPNATTNLQATQSVFVWKRDADMPAGVYGARAVVLGDKLYIGGGDQMDLAADRVVYEYDINGLVRKWTALPPSPVAYFALAEVNKSLTLVGGWDCSKRATTGQLTVWDREQQQWGAPFPTMPTPRQDATATTHQLLLLVAGGMRLKKPIYDVELLDCATFQWSTIQPLPMPSVGMTSCVVKNTWYLLGGTNFTNPMQQGECGPLKAVFSLSLEETVASNSWNVLTDTDLFCSTAVALGDYLMSVGGTNSPGTQVHSSALFLFSPALEKWLFIGNLPTARSLTTCAMLSKGRLAVLGGQKKGTKNSKTVEILYC